jgi:phage-related protein
MKFKGIDASTFNGLIVTKKGDRQVAVKDYREYGDLPGMSKSLYEDTGTYLSYKRSVEILLKDITQFESVILWLDGAGELVVEDGGYYKARVLTITPEWLKCDWVLLSVVFEIQPFFWLDSGKDAITMTAAGAVTNPGKLPSKPVIKIIGNGDITLNVGANTYQLAGVNEYLTIDSERMIVYKEHINQGKKLVGGFPTLNPGSNNISWSGSVTQVEIKGNWINL